MRTKDNVTIGIEWRFGPDRQANVAPKHVKACLANVQQTNEKAAADCMVEQARGLELGRASQRLLRRTFVMGMTKDKQAEGERRQGAGDP